MPRRRRLALIGLLTALVMTASIVGISSLSPRDALLGPPGVADRGEAPPGWRTEFYRDITFRVPARWGSDVEPLRACRGIPPSYPRDYVARETLVLDDLTICPEDPNARLTEHVLVTTRPSDEAGNDGLRAARRVRGRWVLTRTLSEVRMTVVSADRHRAEDILSSGSVRGRVPDSGCPAHSAAEGPVLTRPQPFDLATVDLAPGGAVPALMVCQYDTDDGFSVPTGGLLTQVSLDRQQTLTLLAEIVRAPAVRLQPCRWPFDQLPDLAVRLWLGPVGSGREIAVHPRACTRGPAPNLGGFDDGTTVRAITPAACRALFPPPATLQSRGSEPGRFCLD